MTLLTMIVKMGEGLSKTCAIFFLTLLFSLPLGMIVALLRMSKNRIVSGITRFFISILRGTPLMLQLLVFYYFPGLVMGKNIWGGGEAGRFLASSIAFIFNYACYFSEIFRGGIQGVPKGQQEAGQVLGMTNRQIFFKVTLLQMVKRIVPPMSNEIITLVKDTSLSRIIALQEIIWAGQAFLKGSQGISGAIWPLFFTGIYYLLFSGVLQLLLDALEKRLDYFKA